MRLDIWWRDKSYRLSVKVFQVLNYFIRTEICAACSQRNILIWDFICVQMGQVKKINNAGELVVEETMLNFTALY